MLRPVRRLSVALLGLVLAACGGGSDPEHVRETVEAFATASKAKDYQRMCDDLLAPKLVEEVESVGLPCEAALEQGLGTVESPQLTIGQINVRGDDATAAVRTSARGEPPSSDVLKLVRAGDSWRIASLGG